MRVASIKKALLFKTDRSIPPSGSELGLMIAYGTTGLLACGSLINNIQKNTALAATDWAHMIDVYENVQVKK
jgi:hypothetical protein